MNYLLCLSLLLFLSVSAWGKGALVLQTDFGVKDGAVSSTKGVINSVDSTVLVSDLTHEIPPFNIWEASYRLMQTVPYWRPSTVFVSVVDPGVGSERRNLVAKLKSGHLVVTPDNGTLTHLIDRIGIESIRIIDEKKYRVKGSEHSYTFFGRDLYANVGALLASGKKSFAEIGPEHKASPIILEFSKAKLEEGTLIGNIPVTDPQYGNLWTNISLDMTKRLQMKVGEQYRVQLFNRDQIAYNRIVPYVKTFTDVQRGEDLIYLNSMLDLAIAINQGNFAKLRGAESGPNWTVKISRP